MKNFFKNRTWDDYLAMAIIGIIILGLILFVIGFYGGFKPENDFPGMDKVSVHKVLLGDQFVLLSVNLPAGSDYNLFTLAGAIDPATVGSLYGMVVVAILGFSLIMLGLAVVVVVIIVGFTWDMIQRKKDKKGSGSAVAN